MYVQRFVMLSNDCVAPTTSTINDCTYIHSFTIILSFHFIHAVPAQVSGVRFVSSTMENTLSVELSRPQSDAPILYYEIRYHRLGHSWQGPIRATTEMGTIQSNLISLTSYGVQVRAVSAIGPGVYSREETVEC